MIAQLIAAGVFNADTTQPQIGTFRTKAPAIRTARAQPGTSVLLWLPKDPDETIDYGNDLSDRISDDRDSIAKTDAFVVSDGGTLEVVDHYVNASEPLSTTTWLSGGNEGEEARVLIRSTTAHGRKIDQTVSITISTR